MNLKSFASRQQFCENLSMSVTGGKEAACSSSYHGFNSSSLGRRARSLLWLHRLDRQRGVFLCLGRQNLLLWYLQLCASPQSKAVSATRSSRVLYRLIDLIGAEEIYFHLTQLTATNLLPVTLSCRRLWSLRSLQWAHRSLKIRLHDLIPDCSSILHALPRRRCSSIWRSKNQIDA